MSRYSDSLELLDLRGWLEEYVDVKSGSRDEIRLQECPECTNSKWKLYVNVEKFTFFCQRCQWGSRIGDIARLMAGVSGRHINDIKIEIASMVLPATSGDEFAGILAKRLTGPPAPEVEELVPELLPGSQAFTGLTGAKVTEYALSRGLTEDIVNQYKLRYAVKVRNTLGPWLVFPVYFYDIPVAYQGRRITDTDPRYRSSENVGKWLWPLTPENLENMAVRGEVILVEGVFDAIALIKLGYAALCTFGCSLKPQQISILHKFGVKVVYCCYDADAYKSVRKLVDANGHQFHMKIMELPALPGNPKADPGDVLVGKVSPEHIEFAYDTIVDSRSTEYWNWKFRKELEYR